MSRGIDRAPQRREMCVRECVLDLQDNDRDPVNDEKRDGLRLKRI